MPLTRVRPGVVIKAVLSGQIAAIERQVDAGGYATEVAVYRHYASIAEVHRVYRKAVTWSNEDYGLRQKGMTYDSFRRYFYYAKQLGLIELVGEGEPMGELLMIKGAGDDALTVPSAPLYYALTPGGAADVDSWLDLKTAYQNRRA